MRRREVRREVLKEAYREADREAHKDVVMPRESIMEVEAWMLPIFGCASRPRGLREGMPDQKRLISPA